MKSELFMFLQSMQDISNPAYTEIKILNNNIQNLLKEVASPKGFIQEYRDIAISLGSIMFYALLTYLFNERSNKRKEKKEIEIEKERQCSKINAALAALEYIRVSLLLAKGQFLMPYKNDLQKIKEGKEIIKTEEEIIKFWKTSDINTLFQSVPIINNLSTFPFENELNFISLVRSPYMVTFLRLVEELNIINSQIKSRNDLIEFHMKETIYNKNETAEKIRLFITLHLSFADNLDNMINSSLALIEISISHLNDYATNFLPGKKLLNFKLKTLYDNDMPPLDYLGDYNTMIQQSIKEVASPL